MDFLCLLRLRPEYKFDGNWTDATNKILTDHSNYLVGLHHEGKIKFVSRTDYGIDNDSNMGLAVYVADDEASARNLMLSDPCIVNKIMDGELHPLKIFMLGDRLLDH